MMTREEKAKAIRAGQKAAWEAGVRWGNHIKGNLAKREQLAVAVDGGDITLKAAADEIGIHPATLREWMRKHGFQVSTKRSTAPTERDLKALREYWNRECGVMDVVCYTGRCWATVHKWINAGYGKEQKNAE